MTRTRALLYQRFHVTQSYPPSLSYSFRFLSFRFAFSLFLRFSFPILSLRFDRCGPDSCGLVSRFTSISSTGRPFASRLFYVATKSNGFVYRDREIRGKPNSATNPAARWNGTARVRFRNA